MDEFIPVDKNHTQQAKDSLAVAESSREATAQHSFVGGLFMGHVDFNAFVPFPAQSPEDRHRGDPFLQKLEAFLENHLGADVADEIDRTGNIPPTILKGLAEIGAFGIK